MHLAQEIHYIYIIENEINRKIYVGQTKNPKERWARHKRCVLLPRGHKRKQSVHYAMEHYGVENFSFALMKGEEYATQEAVNEAEIFWIAYFNSMKKTIGYNRTPGGHKPRPNFGTISNFKAGQEHSGAKLTEQKVLEIVSLYRTENYTQNELANKFNITTSGISAIITGKTWSQITGIQPGTVRPPKYNWPSDEDFVHLIDALGYAGTANELNIPYQAIASRIRNRKLVIENPRMFDWPSDDELRLMLGKYGANETATKLNVKRNDLRSRIYRHGLAVRAPKFIVAWPDDKELVSMVAKIGYDAVASKLQCKPDTVRCRVVNRKLGPIEFEKSPWAKGENQGSSKLKNAQVLEIVKLYSTGNYSRHDLGKQFSVDKTIIGDIVNGKIWRSITGLEEKAGLTGNTILNERQVLDIVKLRKLGHSLKELAEQFGVKIGTISSITGGHTWSHITGITPKSRKPKS